MILELSIFTTGKHVINVFASFCSRAHLAYTRACLITLHSNFEIFQKGNPAVEVMLDRRIFER